VIIADHLVPEKLRDARKGIAEHGAADVTDIAWVWLRWRTKSSRA